MKSVNICVTRMQVLANRLSISYHTIPYHTISHVICVIIILSIQKKISRKNVNGFSWTIIVILSCLVATVWRKNWYCCSFKSHRHCIGQIMAFPAVTGGGRLRVSVRALCYPSRVADVLWASWIVLSHERIRSPWLRTHSVEVQVNVIRS